LSPDPDSRSGLILYINFFAPFPFKKKTNIESEDDEKIKKYQEKEKKRQ